MIYQRTHSMEVCDDDYVKHFGSLADARRQCFNIGAGTWRNNAWTNIDLPPQSPEFARIQAPCIYHNLVGSEELPIPAGSAQLVYTSHVIEHLPEAYVDKLLVSVHRALKRGGIFRLVTGPDADTDYSALLRNDEKWWYFYQDTDYAEAVVEYGPMSATDKWLLHLASPRSCYSRTPCEKKYAAREIEQLIRSPVSEPNRLRDLLTAGLKFNLKYPGDHLSWWSGEKLLKRLLRVGFSNAEKSAYGQSRSFFMRDLRYFDTTYPQISLYVECVRE